MMMMYDMTFHFANTSLNAAVFMGVDMFGRLQDRLMPV